ncbi:MAG: hypothetical protein ACTHLA_01805 [Asticcacaulis sp.]|uniref:hypothetical protein n=1 Tax=Asticcacaulis sp. TaxID=1872648 RepID=UPI003F7BF05B
MITLTVPVVLAAIVFALYHCGLRAGCRWAAWLAALIMAGASFTILHGVARSLTAAALLGSLTLMMAAAHLIARQRLGRQEAGRHSSYRVHRLKRGVF